MASATREIWLDGLRGVAAVIVACLHLTAGKLAMPFRSFWDSPASENRHFFQIAPFRIIFAGQAMVDIFFVVSGYSISIGLIKLRNDGPIAEFYQKLTSSVVRRMFRLCFPVAVMMLISHALFYGGLYVIGNFGETEGCPGAKPWGSPIPHIQCLVRSFIGLLNLETNQDVTLNSHFWTIPVEIRGSMKVYLALLGLSTVSELARLLAIGLLAVRFWWDGVSEFLAFFAGLLFAELDARKHHGLQLPTAFTLWDQSQLRISKGMLDKLTIFVHYYIFALGVYLLCLPVPQWQEGALTPTFQADWFFLSLLPPLPWWDSGTTMRTWHSIGAILTISSIRALPRLRAPFESRVAQFLGHISFSLYLCHLTVYRILLERTLNWTSLGVSGINYWTAYHEERNGVLFVTWVASIGILATVLMLASRYMAKSVDKRSVGLSYHMERLLSRL